MDGVTAVTTTDETLPIRAARLSPEETVVLGDDELVLGRYRLLRRIGSGGFGVVWLALDERLERHVAVKAIPRVERGKARGEREAFAAARLNHPGIVALFEAGEDDESRYLVSELVRGRTMSDLLAEGALSDRDVARIGTALCDALAHAHAQGVVHRDVKPANVMIPERPAAGGAVAKLMDFGIAQLAGAEALTRTGDVVGTIAYMAPEQAEGRRVGPAADVYSLGIVLYEAFAGENPVRRAGAAATARRIGSLLPPLARKRRDLPPELCEAIDRAVRPRPQDRGELDDLRDALADSLRDLRDEGRVIAGSPVEGLVPPALPRHATRIAAGLGAGALAWAAWATLGPEPPYAPALLAALTAVAVSLFPRAAWIVSAIAIVGWLGLTSDARPGAALLVGVGALACPVLLPRSGRLWSVPGAAPALGALGLAAAYPALAGQVRGWWQRASLGALGFWWLSLAEPLTRSTLFFGALRRHPPARRLGGLRLRRRPRRARAAAQLGRARRRRALRRLRHRPALDRARSLAGRRRGRGDRLGRGPRGRCGRPRPGAGHGRRDARAARRGGRCGARGHGRGALRAAAARRSGPRGSRSMTRAVRRAPCPSRPSSR